MCVCVCVYVHGHILGRGGGGRGEGVEAPHSPGPGSFESCWLFLEGPRGSWAGPAGLRQAVYAGAWTLADTKLVASGVLTSPLAEAGHAFPLLTRLARCRRFPVLGSVFSLG